MDPTSKHTDLARDQYRGEAGRAYHELKRALPPTTVPWVARARAEIFQPFVKPTDVVFEFGCGYGWNLMSLRCARKIGYDPAEVVQNTLSKAGIESIPAPNVLPPGSCDVVISHHSLEHVGDPFTVLVEMKRLLKRQGRLMLAVPYEIERRYRHYDPAEPNHHLYSWNVQTLPNLVSVSGYKILHSGLRRYGYDRFAARLAARFHLGESGFRLVKRIGWVLKPLHEVAITAAIE